MAFTSLLPSTVVAHRLYRLNTHGSEIAADFARKSTEFSLLVVTFGLLSCGMVVVVAACGNALARYARFSNSDS